ncbi:MAG: Bifunctional protein HldE [Chlamydiae bacterium]|nr:Bifunctional protein HldE [Chlamydiota bacterium]
MSLLEVIESKSVAPENLEAFRASVKEEGKTLATINGSFDLLHPGHLEMLYEASLQADVLLVLLNTDRSIQVNKGPQRPINPLHVRLTHIASLAWVGHVSWFDEEDPRAVLERIKPDVHVNGSEYGEDCIEAQVVKRYGGKIYIVNLVEGFSSTNLIEKIQSLCV